MQTRRHFINTALGLGGVGLGGLGLSGAALAQFRVEISGVGATQVPIALLRYRDEDKSPVAVSAVVRADLERSGLFSFVESAKTGLDDTSRPAMPDWRALNVDALSAGSVTRLADGRYDVRYRLWDGSEGSVGTPDGGRTENDPRGHENNHARHW